MRYGIHLLIVVALAFGLARVCDAAEKSYDKVFEVRPGGALYLSADVGSVRVNGGAGNHVAVKVEVHGSESFIKGFEFKAWQEGDDVHIKTETPKSIRRIFSSDRQGVGLTVTVPARYNVDVSTSGGDVRVTAIEGTVRGNTSGGGITATGVAGSISLGTSGGDIEVENVDGRVEARTSGGDVIVSGVKGDVTARTSGGNVNADEIEGAVIAHTSGGDVAVIVRSANQGVRAETSGGNIRIALGSDVRADLDAETSGGSVRSDLPVTVQGKLRKSSMRGKINGGGPLIWAHTSGGNVRIRAAEEK